jgi:hypothetical protein
MSWFLTDQKLYVFDTDIGSWEEFAFTPPNGHVDFQVWSPLEDRKDYLFFELRETDENMTTLLTYSHITHTFSELANTDDHLLTFLEKGFVFRYDGYRAIDDYFGGYSAVSAEFVTIDPEVEVVEFSNNQCYLSNGSIELPNRSVFSFYYKTFVDFEISKFHFCAFNTETGVFDTTSFNYVYRALDGTYLLNAINGSNFSLVSTYEKGTTNLMSHFIYSGESSTFSDFNTGLEYYSGSNLTSAGYYVTLKNDMDNILGLNPIDETHTSSALLTPLSKDRTVSYFSSNGWGGGFYHFADLDSLLYFSYNSESNEIHQFCLNSPPAEAIGEENIYMVCPRVSAGAEEYFIYCPGTDEWHNVDVTSNMLGSYKRDYIVLYNKDDKEVVLTDGVTGEQFSLSNTRSTYDSQIFDNFLILYLQEGENIAYSTFTRSFVSETSFGTKNWYGNVAVAIGRDLQDSYIGYNALNSTFSSSLDLDSEVHGIWRVTRVGDSLGLVAYSNGYIYVFDPFADSSGINLSKEYKGNLNEDVVLEQNCPNPFATSTIIKYCIPYNEKYSTQPIQLNVYNSIGSKVTTLVDEQKAPGKYKVEFEPDNLSSGIYYYQLNINSSSVVKRMVLLK